MFRIKTLFKVTVLALVTILLSSCESNSWFHSEDTLKSKIQKTWDLVLPHKPYEWIFKEGKFQQFEYGSIGIIDSTSGNYSIRTTYTKAFLTITDVPADKDAQYGGLNATWEIIELDGGLLFIASDFGGSTGLNQKEFTER